MPPTAVHPTAGSRRTGTAPALVAVGITLMALAVTVAALQGLTRSTRVLAAIAVLAILLPLLVARPRWCVPAFIGLTWTAVGRASFGGLPTPVEVAGPLLLAAAGWFAIRQRGLARDAVVICSLLALPMVVSAVTSDSELAIPGEDLKNLTFLLIVALCIRAAADVHRTVIALAVVGIFLGVGAVYSVQVGPTMLFQVTDEGSELFGTVSLRAAGTFGDPNFFALSLAALLPLTGYLTVRGGAGAALGITSTVAVVAGLLATQSRGGFVAAAFGVLVFGLISRSARARWTTVAMVVIAVAMLPLFSSVSSSLDRPVGGRASENLIALRMFFDHPVLGVGPGQYEHLYRDYTRRFGNDPRTQRLAHSLPLQIAAEQGAVGVLGWLAAALVIVRSVRLSGAWRSLLGRGVVTAAATYLVGSLFLHGGQVRLLYMLVGLTVALAASAGPRPDGLRGWFVPGGLGRMMGVRPTSRMAAAVFAVVLTAACVFAMTRPARYQSSATVVLAPNVAASGYRIFVLQGFSNSGAVNNYVELLDSDRVYRAAGSPPLQLVVRAVPESRAISLTAIGDGQTVTRGLEAILEAGMRSSRRVDDVWSLRTLERPGRPSLVRPRLQLLAAAVPLAGLVTLVLLTGLGRFGDGAVPPRTLGRSHAGPPTGLAVRTRRLP